MAGELEELLGALELKPDTAPALPPIDLGTPAGMAQSLAGGLESGAIKGTASAYSQLGKFAEADKKQKDDIYNAFANASSKLMLIDDLLKPGTSPLGEDTVIDNAFGVSSSLSSVPGFDAIRKVVAPEAGSAKAKLETLRADAFKEAFDSLRGGGSISEKEGQTATQALLVLKSDDLSEKDAKEELLKLRDIYEKARKRNDPTKQVRVLPDGTEVPLQEFINRTSKAEGAGTEALAVTNPTANDAADLSALDDNAKKAAWDAAPSGTMFMLNGERWRKP